MCMLIEPNQFHNFPCPSYPEIRLSWHQAKIIASQFRELLPNAISTLQRKARWACRRAVGA